MALRRVTIKHNCLEMTALKAGWSNKMCTWFVRWLEFVSIEYLLGKL